MPRRLLSAAATSALMLSSLAACGAPARETVSTPPPDLGIDAPSDGGGQEPSDGGGTGEEEPPAQGPDIPAPDPADYAGMDENTPDGAAQAYRYYITLSLWVHQTGDRTTLDALAGPNRGGCDYLNKDIPDDPTPDTLWSRTEISDVEIDPLEGEYYDYEVIYNFNISAHTRDNTIAVERYEVEDLEYASLGGLIWEEDRWIVDGLTIEWGADVV